MRIKPFIILIIALLVSGCGEYEKLLKSSDYELKKTMALQYFEEERYVRANELLVQILPRYRATNEAEDLIWMSSKCYYNMRDYITASASYKNFADSYAYSERAEEATFMTAYCDYMMSPRPALDQSNSLAAIEGFVYFQRRFPDSPKVEESRQLIKELEDKLVEKSYISARLYYDRKQYKAAIVALSNSLKEYPETNFREELLFLKLESTYRYAEKSISQKQRERYQNALDEYYSFIEEFPESEFAREVEKIYKATADILNI